MLLVWNNFTEEWPSEGLPEVGEIESAAFIKDQISGSLTVKPASHVPLSYPHLYLPKPSVNPTASPITGRYSPSKSRAGCRRSMGPGAHIVAACSDHRELVGCEVCLGHHLCPSLGCRVGVGGLQGRALTEPYNNVPLSKMRSMTGPPSSWDKYKKWQWHVTMSMSVSSKHEPLKRGRGSPEPCALHGLQ